MEARSRQRRRHGHKVGHRFVWQGGELSEARTEVTNLRSGVSNCSAMFWTKIGAQLNDINHLCLAGAGGLEPTTLGFGDRCSTN